MHGDEERLPLASFTKGVDLLVRIVAEFSRRHVTFNGSTIRRNGDEFRHSKIVCTIGPASNSPRMIDRLIEAGMDVARLNFSHGTHEEHAANIALLRSRGR